MVRELRKVARCSGEDVAAHHGLMKMIPQWDAAGGCRVSGTGCCTGTFSGPGPGDPRTSGFPAALARGRAPGVSDRHEAV